MSAIKKEEINLLPQRGFESTTTGRILAWVLSSFRIIVIVTEIIVMIAFLSRFWLDAQNTDLNEDLEQKQAVLAASLNFEKEFKDNQKRLKVYSDLTSDNLLKATIADTITKLLPSDVFLTSIVFQAKEVRITGISPGEKSIQQLIVNLYSTDIFTDVLLMEVATDEEDITIFKFEIKVLLEKEEE